MSAEQVNFTDAALAEVVRVNHHHGIPRLAELVSEVVAAVIRPAVLREGGVVASGVYHALLAERAHGEPPGAGLESLSRAK